MAPDSVATAGPRHRTALDPIAAYVPGAAPRGRKKAVLKLASNENPFGPSPKAIEAAAAVLGGVDRYPEAGALSLRAKIALRHGVAPDQVLVGNGSDEVLHLLAHAYLERGRRAVMADPPYGIQRIASQASGARLVKVPLVDFVHDLPAMARAVRPGDTVFVVNPHNPTGTVVEAAALRAFVEAVPPDALVVVDEAYFEFVDPARRRTALDLLPLHPGLVVTRTFSKVYGLAGLRVGYAIASASVLAPVEKIRPPFNVSSPAIAAALAALDDDAHLRTTVEGTCAARAILLDACARIGLAAVPSETNFVLVEDRGHWVEALAGDGISVRPGSTLGVPGWARVSLARPDQMRRVTAIIVASEGTPEDAP